MDLKVYYRKVRKVEEQIEGPDAIVMSCETADGGRAGVPSEVPKRTAAKLIVDGKARLADEAAAAAYRDEMEKARERALEESAAKRVRVAIVPEGELKSKRSSPRSARS